MPRSFTPLPWKKSYRVIPQAVAATLRHADPNVRFVVCAEKVISEEELRDHAYLHLNLETVEDIPVEFEPFIPSPTVGSASHYNATPKKVLLTHLGLIWKPYRGRAPTRSTGRMHPTNGRRRVRQYELVPPSMFNIAFKRLGANTPQGVSVFFQITEVLHGGDRKGILRCLNLLQENVGVAELRPVAIAEAEALKNLNQSIGWEILRDDCPSTTLARMYRRTGGPEAPIARRAQERLRALRDLNPTRTFLSTRGLVGYLAVEYCKTLTIFEHLEIDHAMFIARGPAEEFIALTRAQLRAKLGGTVERRVHRTGWEERLRRDVRLARGDQSANPGEML